jgi:hypothetical protein
MSTLPPVAQIVQAQIAVLRVTLIILDQQPGIGDKDIIAITLGRGT